MCTTMQCDGSCGKPKVHYTMSHQTQAQRFEALEERLQRLEFKLDLLLDAANVERFSYVIKDMPDR